ncbi:MAG: hypothetical protein U0Y10_03440 [Spirosomataceae bacterium]
MSFRSFVLGWIPPTLLSLIRRLLNYLRPAPWQYVIDGWQTPLKTRGWNLHSIAQIQLKKWGEYSAIVASTRPLGINHEDTTISEKNIIAHNLMMTFAYVLSLNSRNCQQPTLLDWGGGIGHYGLLAKHIIEETTYFCYDLPELCKIGRQVFPEGCFFDNREEVFKYNYDLVYAGSSLWYDEQWKETASRLCNVTNHYLCVNKMIFVDNVPSFVAIQRPRGIYDTEYLCWIFNKTEFVDYIEQQGFRLVRELLIDQSPYIFKAPEQGTIAGFLFKKLS